ncbi:helix-loop-helix DNA-binding domain-containing protein [Colletotrichum karsti]|uniref:Helix-loop-helix DNA-binding domain-containing protein n=1 Tax=Colletotrichum karsti TaxID=1095194 RepID=A0A9P6LF01_9PEZI|nr:helix-loop-helix DNA-binding domain-containing protein [Colletotrichum karsti]KAF9869792.1 helix-loop-helix DNA-binding domain-containing protein [Colletotrichum karsti]
MAQHGFGQFNGGHGPGGSIDPNDLAMGGNFASSYSNNFNSNSANNSNGFSSGNALFGDDELLDGLSSPTEQPSMHGHGQDFGGMSDMNSMGGFNQTIHGSYHGMDQPNHINGYSNTPDGDPIQSPFVHSFNNSQFRQLHNPHSLGNSLASPISYSGSPLTGSDLNNESADANYLNAKNRARMAQAMQRKSSSNTRSPMTPKSAMHSVPETSGFGPQSIRTQGMHEKSPSAGGQWMQTPTGSMAASYGSGFSSPIQPGLAQLNEVMMKGGTSMPAKLGVQPGAVSSQEMKRKRRRESHNLVERRRRDNINERIQDLSRLVPAHRLEDEKIRKMIQNGTPLSPTLTGISNPSQATSGLAGPGARRAAGGTTGNITTGLPIEDKDKGPNKGDILNGAVSWTRDLMWMLHLKLQQQEELMNAIAELGGHFPFELTEDEKRMQTELMEAISKNDDLGYSRASGSGLRVPHHTDFRGEPLNGATNADGVSVSPGGNASAALANDLTAGNEFWNDPDDDDSGPASLNFKEEDEFGMDLTQ